MENREAITIFRTIQKCRHQALHTNDCGNCERCQYYLEQEQIDGAVAIAISALEKQEQERWIPVTERLPEEPDEVLVTDGDGEIRHAVYCHVCKKDVFITYEESMTIHEVIAWRPLPEAYTEEEEVTKTKNYTAGYRDCAGCMYELLTTNREYPCSDCREMVGPDYPNRYELKEAANDEP